MTPSTSLARSSVDPAVFNACLVREAPRLGYMARFRFKSADTIVLIALCPVAEGRGKASIHE
jgi:hypothetical protein